MKTNTKRTHRGRTTYKLLTLGVLGMLVATVGVNAAKNLQTFAADVPSWGNDGMGIIFTDNYIKDENGNVSKQSSTASFGETVDYSVKLNAKQHFGGNTAAAYVANIVFDSSLSFDESSLQIKVGGVTVDPGELGDTYHYAYEKDENTGVGELAVAIRYVGDFTAQGQCVPFAPATNVREDAVYWLMQKAKRPTCSEGSLFEESGYFTNIVSDRQDAEIEISFSAKYDMAPSKEDNIGTVTASYDYIYFDPSNEIKRAEDVDETTATVQSGNLLIRKTDPDGNPLKGAKFTIDNLRAKNMGGIYYPEEEGMHKFFTSNDFGEILIKGVRLGDYTVREIEAPEGYEVTANPFTVTVSPETTKQLTYKHVKMSSATFSATDADMSAAVTMFPNGELAMINGDVATFYWDENQGKYIFSNDATGYIIKDMDGSLHMNIRDMQISYEPTGEDGEYRQEGASLLFNVHEENGLMTIRPSSTAGNIGSGDADSHISFLDRGKGLSVRDPDTDAEMYYIDYDPEMDMYYQSITLLDGFGGVENGLEILEGFGKVVENDDGTIAATFDKLQNETLTYDESVGAYSTAVSDGEATVIMTAKKIGEIYIFTVSEETDGETQELFFPLYYYEPSGAYIFNPKSVVRFAREYNDGRIELTEGVLLSKITDTDYVMVMPIFPIPIPVKAEMKDNTVLATELVVVNGKNGETEQTPQAVPNPQTSDTLTKAACIILAATTSASIIGRKLSRR